MVKKQINSFDITISSYCQAFCAGCQRNNEDGTPSNWIKKNQLNVYDYGWTLYMRFKPSPPIIFEFDQKLKINGTSS